MGDGFDDDDLVEGETRLDEHGNAMVKTGEKMDPNYVNVTDIFGGHFATVHISEWQSWEPVER